jgi:hypothetical protein
MYHRKTKVDVRNFERALARIHCCRILPGGGGYPSSLFCPSLPCRAATRLLAPPPPPPLSPVCEPPPLHETHSATNEHHNDGASAPANPHQKVLHQYGRGHERSCPRAHWQEVKKGCSRASWAVIRRAGSSCSIRRIRSSSSASRIVWCSSLGGFSAASVSCVCVRACVRACACYHLVGEPIINMQNGFLPGPASLTPCLPLCPPFYRNACLPASLDLSRALSLVRVFAPSLWPA